MISTKCAICNNHENYKVLYEENLPKEGVSPHVYAPRRKRDYVHYRLVECNSCGLVRSNPIIEQTEMNKVYQKSECAYTDENENGTMDFNTNGMPKESYGASNNDMSFGPPVWSDSKFIVGEENQSIAIRF